MPAAPADWLVLVLAREGLVKQKDRETVHLGSFLRAAAGLRRSAFPDSSYKIAAGWLFGGKGPLVVAVAARSSKPAIRFTGFSLGLGPARCTGGAG